MSFFFILSLIMGWLKVWKGAFWVSGFKFGVSKVSGFKFQVWSA